jgi:thioredoxin 1
MEINEDEFRAKIESGERFVADFFAVWCGPCRAFAPVFEKASQMPQTAPCGFVKINVDNCPNISEEYGIRSVPTVILFDRGKAVNKHIGGFKTAAEVTDFIRV